jgi:hypothetical protein
MGTDKKLNGIFLFYINYNINKVTQLGLEARQGRKK